MHIGFLVSIRYAMDWVFGLLLYNACIAVGTYGFLECQFCSIEIFDMCSFNGECVLMDGVSNILQYFCAYFDSNIT